MNSGMTASVNEFVVLKGMVASCAQAASGPMARKVPQTPASPSATPICTPAPSIAASAMATRTPTVAGSSTA